MRMRATQLLNLNITVWHKFLTVENFNESGLGKVKN